MPILPLVGLLPMVAVIAMPVNRKFAWEKQLYCDVEVSRARLRRHMIVTRKDAGATRVFRRIRLAVPAPIRELPPSSCPSLWQPSGVQPRGRRAPSRA
jgi:hypothetical protein